MPVLGGYVNCPHGHFTAVKHLQQMMMRTRYFRYLPEKSPDRRFLNGRVKDSDLAKSDLLHSFRNNNNPRDGRYAHLGAVFSMDEAENSEIGCRPPNMTIEKRQLMPLGFGTSGRGSGGSQKELNAALSAYLKNAGWTGRPQRAKRHDKSSPIAAQKITVGSFQQPDLNEAA